jgi:thioredoxin reductase
MTTSDVLVIGAGPFGLSISHHLRHRDVEHTIVGRPMDTWRNHMPVGMFLKSEPYGSSISSATRGYDIATYAKVHGLTDYVARVGPLSIGRFVDYADWFTDQLVPDVRDITVTNVTAGDDGFKVEFAEESPVFARQVIVATGLLPYQYVPRELSGLPADLLSHTSAHSTFDQFRGKRVAVIGGGQSALQTGALLHEAGAEAQVIVRSKHVWETPIPQELSLIGYIKSPPSNLCEGWDCVFYDMPDAFRMLPPSIRVKKALTTLGPAGAWWLRDRVEGVIEVLNGHPVKSAETYGSGVRLHLGGSGKPAVDVDHVIAGTGFHVDVADLPFLSAEIKAGLVKTAGCPLVNRAGESSVRGLYFSGAHTMVSNGPTVRFVSGTFATAARLAKSVARRARKGAGSGQAAA